MKAYKASSGNFEHIPNDNTVGCQRCVKNQKALLHLLWCFPHCSFIGWQWPPAVFQNVHRTMWAELMFDTFSPKAYSATLIQNSWGWSGEAAVEKIPNEKHSSFRLASVRPK